MALRQIMGWVSLVLIAASLLFMFFTILPGSVNNTTPLNKTYFLRVDTSSIAGARPVSQWTFFNVCGAGNTDCGPAVPALPFGYAWVGGGDGAPAALVGKHGKGTTSSYYYYIWRFGWVFYLIALLTNAIGFLLSVAAPFSRLASGLAGFFTLNALFWLSLAAALMTVEFVKARNVFRDAGISASLGRWAFGWTWAAWFALFLSTIFLFLGCGASRKSSDQVIDRGGRRGIFGRKKSKRSIRGSFIDAESQRRVKEEYS